MWFRETFGFDEVDRANVLSQFVEDGEYIVSRPTGRRFRRGTLGLPTLDALRRTASALTPAGEPTTLTQVGGVAAEPHRACDSALEDPPAFPVVVAIS